jgi:hypothetical protein
MGRRSTERGRLVTAVLAGSWRADPPDLSITREELVDVIPLLMGAGAGGLAWWRLRKVLAPSSRSARLLREAYRLHTIQAAVHQANLRQILLALQEAGLAAVLFKGWAVGRLYPEQGLRPYGDFDLYVCPEHETEARRVLSTSRLRGAVDLHTVLDGLDHRDPDEVETRTRRVPLGDLEVRVLGPEDNLRLLCSHLLRHGAGRALWLCDIGVILEQLPPDFDWDYCLSGEPYRSEWVALVLALAQQLLGARLDEPRITARAEHLPGWLLNSILELYGASFQPGYPDWFAKALLRPWRLPAALRARWPNPIEATYRLGAPLNERPRLPFQIAEYLLHAFRYLSRPETYRLTPERDQ